MSGRRGTVGVMAAALAVPLVVLAGLALDTARLWLVQARLQTALDAASLTMAREIGQSGSSQDGLALFWANWGRTAAGSSVGFLGAIASTPRVSTPDSNTVLISVNATVPTTLLRVAGINSAVVSASSASIRATWGLEVALVLDNTGSMAGWPIQSVVSSATSLVNILYGTGSQDTQPNLWVSVVPFTAQVNIGPQHTNWLQAGSYTATAWKNTTWMGCVMARYQNGNDFTDATPAQAPFLPFLYPSTVGKYKVSGKTIVGDNDWSTTKITEGQQATLPDNTAVGPNLGCSPVPVLPETTSRTTVLNTISQMVAVFRGGTFINLGLQAGWWTLSPTWQGVWGNPTLPLAYNTPHMRKAIVLMTDGNNEWYDWAGGAPGAGPSGWSDDGDTDYAAYGRLKQNLMGLGNNTKANATTNINTRMATMCSIIKQSGIIIYTVLFNHSGVSSATQSLFQNCASSPQNYFLTPTDADLQAAFQQIGSQLANLRLSQ